MLGVDTDVVNAISDLFAPLIGVPSDVYYLRIFASEYASNPDTDIIFSHPSIRMLDANTDMIKAISNPYLIQCPKAGCLIMISVWKRLFFNGMKQ